jgi:hypothetical protein
MEFRVFVYKPTKEKNGLQKMFEISWIKSQTNVHYLLEAPDSVAAIKCRMEHELETK